MKRLFILQVLLFIDWPELLIGADVFEESSHDKFVVHIPIHIPIAYKQAHSVLKITQNDGKSQHSLAFYHPTKISTPSHQQKNLNGHDRKPKSKSRPQHHSKGSSSGRQHGKKANQSRDEDKEEKIHLNSDYAKLLQQLENKGHYPDFFGREHSLVGEKLKHDFENPTRDYLNYDKDYFNTNKDHHGGHHVGGRADRGHKNMNSKARDSYRFVYDQKKKSNVRGGSPINHSSKRYKSSPNGGGTQQYRLTTKNKIPAKKRDRSNRSKFYDHTPKNHQSDFDDVFKNEQGVPTETNSDFHSEDAKFNYGSFSSKTNYESSAKPAPDLHPSWADEGLISPFALNDVLFKDKKYSKKVFKELGFYPLFLPYEVNENQEKK